MGLFYDSPFIVTSRTEQAAFLMFAPVGATIIELAPTYISSFLAPIATQAGLNYFLSLGGLVINPPAGLTPLDACNQKFAQCRGESKCCENNIICTRRQREAYERLAYNVDLNNFALVMEEALHTMRSQCGPRWTGPTVAVPAPVVEDHTIEEMTPAEDDVIK